MGTTVKKRKKKNPQNLKSLGEAKLSLLQRERLQICEKPSSVWQCKLSNFIPHPILPVKTDHNYMAEWSEISICLRKQKLPTQPTTNTCSDTWEHGLHQHNTQQKQTWSKQREGKTVWWHSIKLAFCCKNKAAENNFSHDNASVPQAVPGTHTTLSLNWENKEFLFCFFA